MFPSTRPVFPAAVDLGKQGVDFIQYPVPVRPSPDRPLEEGEEDFIFCRSPVVSIERTLRLPRQPLGQVGFCFFSSVYCDLS